MGLTKTHTDWTDTPEINLILMGNNCVPPRDKTDESQQNLEGTVENLSIRKRKIESRPLGQDNETPLEIAVQDEVIQQIGSNSESNRIASVIHDELVEEELAKDGEEPSNPFGY